MQNFDSYRSMKDRIPWSGSIFWPNFRKNKPKNHQKLPKIQNSVSFDISKVRQIRIRRHILENRRFRAILGRFRKKKRGRFYVFLRKSHEIAQNCLKLPTFSWQILKDETLRIPKHPDFLKNEQYTLWYLIAV